MKKKAVVIGLDGLEPRIVEDMLQRGRLPNLKKLLDTGCYSRLRTTYPAQTPVAWSSFVTGANPGAHGIFDFLCRDPETYLPDVALSCFERAKNKLLPPRVVNRRKGVPVWEILSKADIPSVVLRCPCTFPPENLKGRMLAGVGVPDLRGSQSKGTFYTQDRSSCAAENEQLVLLDGGDPVTTKVFGPRNTRQSPATDTFSEITLKVDTARDSLVIETRGTPAVIQVREKSWSEWVRLKFKISMLQSVYGIARFYVKQVQPQIEMYVSAINFDPAAPLFPISSPNYYAAEICEQLGPFSTLGMAEEHNGLNNGRLDERAYIDHCRLVLKERERLMRWELARFQEGLFFMVFDTPDRLQHMLWRFRDPEHPLYDQDSSPEFAVQVEEHYAECDALLAPVLEKMDSETLVIVLSDHGFGTFRRAFDTNTWLAEKGLLTLRNGRKPGPEESEGLRDVDWSKTHAYALGLGGIYLNMKGREHAGILEEGSAADRVRTAIQSGLSGFVDRQSNVPAIRSVSRREELYSGAYVGNSPDLLVNFHRGFRVSWQTAVGGFAEKVIFDNSRRWSGDHIVDPESVPGILFLNRKITAEAPNIIDLAPAILQHLGAPVPPSVEGQSLLS